MRPREHHEGERLSAFLDDELPEADSLAVTRHLATCDRCLEELDAIRAARNALRGLPNLQPPSQVFAEAERCAAVRSRQLPLRLSLAMLALAVVVGTVFFAGAEQGGDVAPPIDVYVGEHVVRSSGGPLVTPVNLGR